MIAEGLSEMNDECEAIDAWLMSKPKIWKCPDCKKERYIEEDAVLSICYCCQVKMEVVDGL